MVGSGYAPGDGQEGKGDVLMSVNDNATASGVALRKAARGLERSLRATGRWVWGMYPAVTASPAGLARWAGLIGLLSGVCFCLGLFLAVMVGPFPGVLAMLLGGSLLARIWQKIAQTERKWKSD